jgi:Zn-dependent protease
MTKNYSSLFTIADTEVTAEPSALFSPLNVFGLTVWLSSGVPGSARLRRGLLAALAYEVASVIHTIGHIISSRRAGAPMDRFHLTAPLPRTVYYNNEISPQAHLGRAIGGPIASGLAFLLTLALWPFVSDRSVLGEFLRLLSFINGLLGAGSLLPLPFIDGGVLLKWSLVERGQPAEEADQVVRQANLLIGILAAAIGLILVLKRQSKGAILSLVNAGMFVATGLDKLKL